MANHYSCWTYIDNQAKLMNLNLLCKQSGLNLSIFDRNEGDFREKSYVSIETRIHTCGY